jgi:hypothetical protein
MNAKSLGSVALIGIIAVLSACRGGDRTPDTAAGTTAGAATRTTDTSAAMDSTVREAVMSEMHTHTVAMERASADSVAAMLAMHRQMLDSMISRFDREMRSMNMPADASWQATIDSLRQDNTRMQQMSASQLKAAVPAHHGRIMRLMASHRSMMSHKM